MSPRSRPSCTTGRGGASSDECQPISWAQQLQLELIQRCRFNSFDGTRVVRDLLARRELWISALMDRDDLVKLRDLSDGSWNVDTLYVLVPNPSCAQRLVELGEPWQADTVDVRDAGQACHALGFAPPDSRCIVVMWWD